MRPSSVRVDQTQGDRKGHTKRLWGHPCEDGGRDVRDAATSQGMLGPPQAGRGKEGALRQNTALLTPRFQTSSLRNCEKLNSCCVKVTPSMVITTGGSGPTPKTCGSAQQGKKQAHSEGSGYTQGHSGCQRSGANSMSTPQTEECCFG